MNISKFDIREMYNNSKGKTSLSLVCAHTLVITGCVIGLYGAYVKDGNAMMQGIAYASLGAGLLGLRRFTADKEIKEEVTKTN